MRQARTMIALAVRGWRDCALQFDGNGDGSHKRAQLDANAVATRTHISYHTHSHFTFWHGACDRYTDAKHDSRMVSTVSTATDRPAAKSTI